MFFVKKTKKSKDFSFFIILANSLKKKRVLTTSKVNYFIKNK